MSKKKKKPLKKISPISKQVAYLDYNIYVPLLDVKNEPTKTLLKQCSKYQLRYSPAHMEEIAVPNMHGDFDEIEIEKKIQLFRELTSDRIFKPADIGTIRRTEHPRECFDRCVKDYSGNLVIEENEAEMLKKFKGLDPESVRSSKVSNISTDTLLVDDFIDFVYEVLESDHHCRSEGFHSYSIDRPQINKYIQNIHSLHFHHKERYMELLFNLIEYIRFKPEKVKKSRSRMHDVSHAIYASSAEIFVSNDKKFREKTKAVYKFLGITTAVLSFDEFIEVI